jgi:hypothetical protein
MNNVIAQVGEDTRRTARFDPNRMLEHLTKEKNAVVAEMKAIDYKLSEIEDWKRRETADVLRRRLPKTESITKTASINSEARDKKADLLRARRPLEERLNDISSRLQVTHTKKHSEVNDTLLRIERLLVTLIRRLPEVP